MNQVNYPRRKNLFSLGLLFWVWSGIYSLPSAYASTSSQGEVSYDFQKFPDDKSRETLDSVSALGSTLEAEFEKGAFRGKIRGKARANERDRDQSYVVIEDLWLRGKFRKIELSVGYQVFSWTANEFFHPADVVNSRNFKGDFSSVDKIGEFSVSLTRKFERSLLEFHYFPFFEEPLFPSSSARLGLGVKLEKPRWVDPRGNLSQNKQGLQGAIRYAHTLGNADLAFHAIHHQDRLQPLIGFEVNDLFDLITRNLSRIKFVPFYYEVRQYGMTYTHAFESFLLKFEGAWRDFLVDPAIHPLLTLRGTRIPTDYGLWAGGVEKGFSFESGSELTFILEGQYLSGMDKLTKAETEIFQQDILFGTRFALNDVMGKEVLLSLIYDIERTHEYLVSFEYKQRLSDDWKIETGYRWIHAPPQSEKVEEWVGLEPYHKDSSLNFSLIRYF